MRAKKKGNVEKEENACNTTDQFPTEVSTLQTCLAMARNEENIAYFFEYSGNDHTVIACQKKEGEERGTGWKIQEQGSESIFLSYANEERRDTTS